MRSASLHPLADKLRVADLDFEHDHCHDVKNALRWALILFDVHPSDCASSLSSSLIPASHSSSTSSSFVPATASSVFYRKKRQTEVIESLRKRLRRKDDVSFRADQGMEEHGSSAKAQENAFAVAHNDASPSFRHFDEDDDGNDDGALGILGTRMDEDPDEEVDTENVDKAAEMLSNWVESHRLQQGGCASDAAGRGVEKGGSTSEGEKQPGVASSFSSTQTRATAPSTNDLDMELFSELNSMEMLQTLRLVLTTDFQNQEMSLGEAAIEQFLSMICAWQKSSYEREDSPERESDALKQICDLLTGRLVIPLVGRFDTAPSRGIVHGIGELAVFVR